MKIFEGHRLGPFQPGLETCSRNSKLVSDFDWNNQCQENIYDIVSSALNTNPVIKRGISVVQNKTFSTLHTSNIFSAAEQGFSRTVICEVIKSPVSLIFSIGDQSVDATLAHWTFPRNWKCTFQIWTIFLLPWRSSTRVVLGEQIIGITETTAKMFQNISQTSFEMRPFGSLQVFLAIIQPLTESFTSGSTGQRLFVLNVHLNIKHVKMDFDKHT